MTDLIPYAPRIELWYNADAALTIDAAGKALEVLKGLAPIQKAILMKGLFAALSADGAIRVAEVELMRLVGAALAGAVRGEVRFDAGARATCGPASRNSRARWASRSGTRSWKLWSRP